MERCLHAWSTVGAPDIVGADSLMRLAVRSDLWINYLMLLVNWRTSRYRSQQNSTLISQCMII